MALELPLLSYDDYAAIEDGRRYQVVDGVLVMSPSPSTRHQDVLLELATALKAFLATQPVGRLFIAPMDVVLVARRPAVVLQPDLVFIARGRDIVTPANVQGAPDLVVEILSPGSARLDMGRKRALYAEHGVKEFWAIPDELDRVEVRLLGEDGRFAHPRIYEPGEVLHTALLPGFGLEVARIFPDQGEEPGTQA